MKKTKDRLKNKMQSGSKTKNALKVLAASTLGLCMLMSAPHMANLVRPDTVGVYNNYQVLSDQAGKSSGKLSSTSTGSTFNKDSVSGVASSSVAVNTGVTSGYLGSTLDSSKLPSDSTITGSWNDSFAGMTYAQLTALDRSQGNIFKDGGVDGQRAYEISNALEFAFFSAAVKANYASNEIKNQTFKLTANIDLAGKEWKPIFNFYNNNTSFLVNFDGQNHTISNVYVYDARNEDGTNTATYASIFGCWGKGEIKNIIVENANIQSWRSAAVIANKDTNYNLASEYENIKLYNCKVVAGSYDGGTTYAVGISTNAKYITDCYMESCEILSTDTDVNLLGQDQVDKALNFNNSYHYALGFGRALQVTNSDPDNSIVGIKNCKIAFESNANNYNALTRNTNKYVYVNGISDWNEQGDNVEYSNITVENCDIHVDAQIGDAKESATLANETTAPYYQNLFAYICGVSRYSRNNTSVEVKLTNINVTNSKIYSTFDYSPTTDTTNKDMYFPINSYVKGVADIYATNPVEASTLYKNIVVKNCDIYHTASAEIKTPQTYLRTNNYDTYTLSGWVAGITNTNNQTSTKASMLNNCKVLDCNLTSENIFKAVDDANFRAYSDTRACGMAMSTNGYPAHFVDCSVDNCNISATTNFDNGTFTGETDYHNPIEQYLYALGMGKGYYTSSDTNDDAKGCKVTNCKIYAKSYDTKDNTVDKVGGVAGHVNVMGLGMTGQYENASIFNAIVDNCEITAEAEHVEAVATGLVRNFNGNAYGFNVKDCKLTNTTISAKSNWSNAYAVGLSHNGYQQNQGDKGLIVESNLVNNVKFLVNSVKNSTFGAAGLFNSYTVTNGLTFKNNTIEQISIDVDKENGDTYLSGGLFNSGAANISVSGNTIKNSSISNNVTVASRTSNAYLAGLVYYSNTQTANNESEIKDNICDNISVSNTVKGSADIYHSVYTSGMIFSSSSAIIMSYNNVVKNSTIKSQSNVSHVYASGLLLQNADRKSVVEECYAFNNNVSTIFERGGSNASRDSVAFGLVGWYSAIVKSCVVGSGTVYAHNDIGNAGATGVAGTRGFANGYSARSSNNESDVWYTQIDDCYNFAQIKAETDSNTSVGYAAGIGRAEIITNCANYGDVTGNYAGGITTGYTQTGTNETNVQHSLGLTIKNCVNAGNICRANGGGQSFVGGIVARYEMRYYAEHKFILENNISLGGVYNSYNETTGEYSQTLSTATFIGMLYGYLSIPSTVSTVNIYDTVSIRNNYMLVEQDGINAGLYYTNNTLVNLTLPVAINTPSANYLASSEGVFYQTNNINTNKTQYEQMYTECMGIGETTNTNTFIDQTYTAETFAKNSNYDAYYVADNWLEWTMPSGNVPQVATSLEKLIVRYDIGEYTGTTPNVDIINKTATEYTYTLSNGRVGDDSSANIIDQVGVSLYKWSLNGTEYNPSEIRTSTTNGIITYNAVVNYTNYEIVLVNDNPQVTISNAEGQINLETTTKEITAQGSNELLVTGFSLQVKNVTTDSWETLQVLGAQDRQATFNLGDFITTEFFSKYATSDEKISIQFVVEAEQLYTFEYTDGNAEGEGHYSISATYSGVDAFTNRAPEGSDIQLQVKSNTYYELISVTIGGVEQLTENITEFNKTITNISDNVSIVVKAQKMKYNVNVMFQNLQGVTLDSSLVDRLIENTTETMSVDSNVPALKAKTDVIGYRFVGWKLFGMDSYLPDTNGTIDSGYIVSQADFARYTSAVDSETKFNIIAVYQRQYQFNVTLNNEYGDSFASEYEVCYVDENGENQILTNVSEDSEGNLYLNSVGNYLIDESTFIQLKIKPNKRVTVVEPENEQFGNNVVYVYLTGNKNVSINFAIRPLTITSAVLNVETPTDNTGLHANQLAHALSYQIKDATGTVIGSSEESSKVNIDNRLTFGCINDVLNSASYRFVELRLLNVQTGNYDVVELYEDGELIVNDAFFDKYVDDNGQISTSMKVIKQYKAEIVGENLVSSDNYELGSYTVEIRDEAGNLADTDRYVVNELNKVYTLDNGLHLVVKAVTEKYAEFAGFSGVFDGEVADDESATVIVNDNRSINLRFEKSTFTLEAPFNSETGGSLEFTKTFQLGDTITISYTPSNNYQIKDWNLAGKTLEELGAVQNGNTITIPVTKEFLNAMAESATLDNEKLTISSEIDTKLTPTLFYGIIGGGAAILILVGVVVILMIRSRNLKKQKEENERKLNDIARKFNVADMIKDLRK
ncbi:MAG: hypothetical protein ACI4T8_00180 [Christensenellales bacterium]